jgi:nitrite reductase (NADH) small subunit
MTTLIESTSTESKSSESTSPVKDWLTICNITDIAKNTGVCADFNGKQVAIFHIKAASDRQNKNSAQSDVKAICNLDPFAQANILSRGLITEKENQFYVASPLLKQEFCLNTGECQQDESVIIPTYKARIEGDLVQLMEG